MSNLATISTPEPKVTVEEVKQYLCPQATDKEVYMFVQLCKSQNLNPWVREAYLIKYGNGPATMVVGKDLFTKRAQTNPKFRGFRAGVIVERNGEVLHLEGSFTMDADKLLGGWAKVYLEGYEVPIEAHVSMHEYAKGQSSWKTMPATMIRKVALVQALREAFPEELGGLYDASEMGVDVSDKRQPITPVTPVVQKDEAQAHNDNEVTPEAADGLSGSQAGAQGYNPVIDEAAVESMKYCTFGKNKGKAWTELSFDQLEWYRDYLERQIADPRKAAFIQENLGLLKGVMDALENGDSLHE